MAVRTTPGSGEADKTGNQYIDLVKTEVEALWDTSCVLLSSVGGTATAITANATPTLTSYDDGAQFMLPLASTTTGAATINIDSVGVIDLVDDGGNALSTGILTAGTLYRCMYDATSGDMWVLGTSQNVTVLDYQEFTSSGTWTKPSANAGSWVIVRAWGGGGGGGNVDETYGGSGGGGGGFTEWFGQVSELSSTETVTIGAGGGNGNPGATGGTTSFGTKVYAYGGGGGRTAPYGGGGGGGTTSAGSAASAVNGGAGGGPLGGAGAVEEVSTAADGYTGGGGGVNDSNRSYRDGANGFWGGGGGAGGYFTYAGDGGGSFFGGGGGGNSASGAAGGISIHGGNGGGVGVNGSFPSGGGGANASGAAGQLRVYVIG